MALCVPIGGDSTQRRSLADEAAATLRAAVAAGHAGGVGIARDAAFAPLRDRDDVRGLMLGLMDRAMPADPVARPR